MHNGLQVLQVDHEPGLRVRLNAGPDNPSGIGAQLRLMGAGVAAGPVREVHAGGGYWSVDDPVTVLANPMKATVLWIRWPESQFVSFF